jgi:hypothetical protein
MIQTVRTFHIYNSRRKYEFYINNFADFSYVKLNFSSLYEINILSKKYLYCELAAKSFKINKKL